MTKRYKKAILIGRFEPFHNGHLRNTLYAASIADEVHILIGSSYEPRTIKNPFLCNERAEMIDQVLHAAGIDPGRITKSYIRDYNYNNNLWINDVQSAISSAKDIKDNEIVILGHEKDDSSWYLRAFPNWDFAPLNGFVESGTKPIDATKIRELYFEGHLDYIKGTVPPAVFDSLKAFATTPEFATLAAEYNYINAYIDSWKAAPYPPTFFTTDAVVIQGGHILLIRRKDAPGKGLWALPGGFLNQKETAINGCIRELREESGLKVPIPVLLGSITYEKLFDNPGRSLRGRTITQAYLIELLGGDRKLPTVRGMDDADKAKWFPIHEVLTMSSVMFDDHFSIIQTMLGRAK